jgi:N-acetylglucosaminyl-diphospho-decaprenol L-rhamnosyltransferase
MSSPIQISIVIVSYQVKELLLACLASIATTKENLAVEVIVIDNNSTDGSVDAVAKHFPQTVLIANNYNAGFSGANNQGMSIAKGEYIFLLNPDTEVHEGALQQLLARAEKGLDSVVAPQLLNSDGSIQISVWKKTTVMNLIAETFFLHQVFKLNLYAPSQLQQDFAPDAASGAALFFSKKLFEKIGGLDDNLFWSEDTDFCTRSRTVAPLYYLANARVTHHSGKSSVDRLHIVLPNQLLSKVKYIRKHASRMTYGLALFFGLIFILSRIVMFGLLSPFKSLYGKKRKAYSIALKKWGQLVKTGTFALT